MGLARNLSKFKPNSDGLVEASDLGFELSSEALTKSIPLKSGATLTAGRAVNINSSGEVGDYPVVNTLGTLATTTVGPYENSTTWVSFDGSRVLKLVNGGGATLQVQGYAITDTTTTAGTAVNWGASGSSSGGWLTYSAQPINNTQFLLGTLTTSNAEYSSQTAYWTFRVVTIDSSGGVTLGTAATFSNGSMGPWNGRTADIYPLPDGRFALFCFCYDSSGYDQYYSRTATVSGTTISFTSDTDMRWYTENSSYLTASNKLIGASGTTVYYCNYDGSTTSSYANASIATAVKSSTGASSVLLNSSYGIVLYQKSNNDFGLGTYSINQTTGVPTITDFKVLGNSTFNLYNPKLCAMSSTDIFLSYKLGSNTYGLSLKLNESGSVIGVGIGLILEATNADVGMLSKTSTTNVARFFYNSSNFGNSRNITINTYDTLSWSSGGAVASSQTTSPASVIISGVCGGFSGLSVGSTYYVNESLYDGSLTTTTGSYLVGTAISSTEILLG
jgi:hypothetical protein